MDIKSSHRTSHLAFCVTAKRTAIQLTLPPKKQLYSSHSLSHGPVALYSYTARAYTAALYNTAYTLYSPIRRPSGHLTISGYSVDTGLGCRGQVC